MVFPMAQTFWPKRSIFFSKKTFHVNFDISVGPRICLFITEILIGPKFATEIIFARKIKCQWRYAQHICFTTGTFLSLIINIVLVLDSYLRHFHFVFLSKKKTDTRPSPQPNCCNANIGVQWQARPITCSMNHCDIDHDVPSD